MRAERKKMKSEPIRSEKGRTLNEEPVVVDGHNHLFMELLDQQNKTEGVSFENFCAPRLAEGGVNVIVTSIGGDNPCLTNFSDMMLLGTLLNIEEVQREIETNPGLAFCTNGSEIDRAIADKKLAIVFSMEGARPLMGRPCLDSPSLLRTFYRLGLRVLQLVDNGRNWIGDGVGQLRTGGRLTHAGTEVIKEMNALGMVIDVSHLNEQGFWDVLELSTQPVIASHSNAKTICDRPRNLSDEQLKGIARSRGVVGISFANSMLSKEEAPGLASILDHIRHMADLIGTDHIGLGPDFSGQVNIYPGKPGWLEGVYTGSKTKQGERPRDFSDVSCFPRVREGLLASGFSGKETRGILGGNFLRLLREVFK
jgi:membrane dipeptidase